ncbi:MAG: MarR family transcriptional regulator [Candidatus Aenigmarchaeota archaeon]|nr:MarR family transcriptional regulator [Candidatus Aenigmarchaeota archaeon]
MTDIPNLLGSESRVAILRKLCSTPAQDFAVSDLSEELKIDKALVSRLVNGFQKDGLVLVNRRRNLKLCKINPESATYQFLRKTFENEKLLDGGKK